MMPVNSTAFHRSLHLKESDLEPPDLQCPFCNNRHREQVYALQKSPEVVLLHCPSCKAVSASQMPTDRALAEYYNLYYDSSGQKANDGQVTFDYPQRLASNLADMYYRYTCKDKTSASILDFGGGDGTISLLTAMQLCKKGIEKIDITVVEHAENGIDIICSQDERIVLRRANSLSEVASHYGMVIASAVIEHYPYPGILLSSLLESVDNGGIFYARTPFILPIIKLFRFIGISIDFTYPGHLHDLSQSFWENYFMTTEFDNFQILVSRPSIVETTLRKHFLRTLAAYLFKAPWYLLGSSYRYVGGWEIFVQKY